MEKFCKSLREHALKIINLTSETLSTIEQQNSYQNLKLSYICEEKIEDKNSTDKKYRNIRNHCHYNGEYRSAASSLCNLKDSVPKEISIIFCNGSNYHYYFIIKDLAEKFEKQVTCLGDNTEKELLKKVTRINKNGEENTEKTSYRLQFIDSARFIDSNLIIKSC